ncbi:peptidoglycan editing factor PgeF [Bacillus mangrovi]|uniref:Purine nucleoside phosphorylase n=1 Tax=Metabacillus mangrovi TaxID=1491830 RepID=A0A7X2V3R8_9BACI|nr:peptidoglycan editing factor PgeF [Metabacillus mangrovi]MTH52650.1 peptidoglycan editing factor PgeF [Metabacillus mangrovi]
MRKEPFISDRRSFLRLQCDSVPSLVAGFTVRSGGVSHSPYSSMNMGLHVGDSADAVAENRRMCAEESGIPLENWTFADQVHGPAIVKTGPDDAGKGIYQYSDAVPETDGLYTDSRNTAAALAFADCTPIFFYEEAAGLAGIAHAGWKGSVSNIAGSMVSRWCEEEGADPGKIHAVIGPSIGPCCYVVDDRVISKVNGHYRQDEELPYTSAGTGQYRLDLKKFNEALLIKAGLDKKNISVSGLCTSCNEDLFFSHRRDGGKTGRMIGFIGWKEEGS